MPFYADELQFPGMFPGIPPGFFLWLALDKFKIQLKDISLSIFNSKHLN